MQIKTNGRYAVIDIGTNSVIMLICEVDAKNQKYEVMLDTAEITRLGHGLHPTHQLQKSAMDRTCATIRGYLAQAESLGVEQVIAVGTSALREATNTDDFINLLKNGFNLDVEVISGEAEARYSYLAVRTDEDFRRFDADNLMLIEGFFKTARFGVEDTLTLFSRQTPPIGGKSAEKSCDSVAFATADTCGLNPPSRWFPSQSPTAQRGSDPVVCHGQRVRYCVLSPTTTGIPDSLVF